MRIKFLSLIIICCSVKPTLATPHCSAFLGPNRPGQSIFGYRGNYLNWYHIEGQTLSVISRLSLQNMLHRDDFESLVETLERNNASWIVRRWTQIMRTLIYSKDNVNVLDLEMKFFNSLQFEWLGPAQFVKKHADRIQIVD